MTFSVITLGCKLNSCESAAIRKAFLADGFTESAEGETSDVYIINSCAVTGTAVTRARHELSKCRRANPDCVAVLCGCFPQSYPEEAGLKFDADIIIGNADKSRLPESVREFIRNRVKTVKISPLSRVYDPKSAIPDENRTRAFIKIEDGCDRFCAYCIIPTARGRVRSLPLDEITRQALTCVEHGHHEIVLTGINLGCYGQDLGFSLSDAVEAAARSGVERVRLSSLEPEMISDSEIERFRKITALCPHFHLSLQSGSNTVLKRMNRKYDTSRYRETVEKLRAAFPECSITTDIIVGFPGETDEEFLETVDFAREIGFAKIHVFPYSIRKGTVAAEMPQLHPRVKSDRARMMNAVSKEVEQRFFESRIGAVQTALIEKPQSSEYSYGFTESYIPVRLYGANIPRHTLVRVQITGYRDGYCLAKTC